MSTIMTLEQLQEFDRLANEAAGRASNEAIAQGAYEFKRLASC